MIGAPLSNIGFDKFKLFVQDYRIKDATRSGFLVQPGTIDLETGTTSDRLLFQDRGGVQIQGAKAIRNTDFYQATITENGLIVQFNPSKPWHPFDLVSDDDTLQHRGQIVFNDLQSKGVNASWEQALLTRIDVARNVLLNGSVKSYNSVWPWINQKRSKYVRQYPSGYGTGNDTWGTIFYDKGEETGMYDGNNLLRAEIQLKRNRAIVDAIGCKVYGQIKQAGMTAIQDVYRTYMQDRVLRVCGGENQHSIQYNDEIEVLKKLMLNSPRTAIGRYMQLMGIPDFIDKYGTPEVYAQVLTVAGYHRNTVLRAKNTVRKQLELYAIVYQDQQNTVGKMLRELRLKLVA